MNPENIGEAECGIVPLSALRDNYIWLLRRGGRAVVVDPGDAAPVLAYLAGQSLELVAVLVTHHHADHVAGITALCEKFPKTRVYGPSGEKIVGLTHPLGEGEFEVVELPGMNMRFQVIGVPGHTQGHLAYYEPNWSGHGLLFSGDTLFSAGCGRLFEGTPEQMQRSLARLRCLPPETRVFCAHEYTEANLRFASVVEPDNRLIAEYAAHIARQRASGLPSLPTTLAIECQINPFLRWDKPTVRQAAQRYSGYSPGGNVDVNVFAAIRAWKNEF